MTSSSRSTSPATCPRARCCSRRAPGPGKTWTIGALVTRYVAEGHARLEEMLVVTFGRAASQELRERVRAQLVEAERVLSEDPAAAARRRAALRPRGVPPRLGRRPAPARSPARDPGPRGVRRRDDRDHPPVLLDGPGLAGSRGRHRLPGAAGRGPRRPGEGDRRRPLPPGVRLRRGRAGVHLLRGDGDRPGRGQRPAVPPRAGGARTARRRSAAGSASPRRSAPSSTSASAGSGSCPTTTCSPSSATR